MSFWENKNLEQEAAAAAEYDCWLSLSFIYWHQTTDLLSISNQSFLVSWSITLVLAWMGAPWSSKISIILTWPFLAAQCRGVSSSWRDTSVSDFTNDASNKCSETQSLCAAPWFWHLSGPLCPAAVGPWSHSPAWMQCAVEWYHSTKKNRCPYSKRTDRGDRDSLCAIGNIAYLWGEVDVGSSIEQQLSYIQVFVVCSDVEGCESSLLGHIKVNLLLSHLKISGYKHRSLSLFQMISHLQKHTHTCLPC